MTKYYAPSMHTVEHILNQTMIRMFNCGRSVSAHIEKKKSRIDYNFQRDVTAEEIAEIERRVNEVIQANLNVTEEFLTRPDAEKQFNLNKLPDDTGNLIRIIRVGNYDACPCSGLHVSCTHDVGEFRIVSTNYSERILRLRFKLSEVCRKSA
jgi:misacylated tRNA(Ala) deacylase